MRNEAMGINPKWIPMKWPCGPIETAKLGKSNNADSDLKKTVEGWTLPEALQLLKGTPVNCLVVDWASGTADDAVQQSALKPLIAAGRPLGLSFVGRIAAKNNLAATITAGRAAGLEAVLLDGSVTQTFDLPAIREFARDSVDWDQTTETFAVTGNAWPGITLPTTRKDAAAGGPTAVPWMDTNGWFALLARQMVASKSLWLDIDLPESRRALTAANYCRTIADSRCYGSHWILNLDGGMRSGLLNRDPQAMAAWSHICATLSFFNDHADWEGYKPIGNLAVVSDFRGQNAFMAGETLNLLNRRQVQFEILDRRRALAGPVSGLKGLLWMDDDAPSAEQHRHLLSFVEQGGLVVASAYWGPKGLTARHEDWLLDYDIYDVGKGRIVVATGGFSDPYLLARDAQLLVGRENDLARLYNPGSTNFYASAAPNRRKQLVQIVNYTNRPAPYVSLWMNMKASGAKLWSPDAQAPNSVAGIAENEGTNFELPDLPVHCAIEFERTV
jgi:hypothetical protein